MIKFMLSVFLVSVLAVPVVQAADEADHTTHHPGADKGQAVSAQDDEAGVKMEKMQENMKKMREQMEKIHAAGDPAERQKLMKEHMQFMQEGMKMMGSGMKGGDMMAKAKRGKGPSMTDGDEGMEMCMMMMKKHRSVESRMDMMQQMMQQMMEHESAEQEMELGR
ncbi:MAG: hypothetical protein ACT4PQ_12955 [Betaproteobacteria bacterium]